MCDNIVQYIHIKQLKHRCPYKQMTLLGTCCNVLVDFLLIFDEYDLVV